MRLLPLFVLWLIATEANACKLEDTWRYSVTLEGTNQLRLKMPVYDKEASDCWVVEGTVYIQIEGQDKEILYHYESEKDIHEDDYRPFVWHRRGVQGTMTLYRERNYSSVNVTTNTTTILVPCVDNQNYAIINLLWDIPNKYRGKKVTITWGIHHNGNKGEANKWIAIEESSLNIPSAPDLQLPMVMDPIISYDASRPNQIMVPYMIASNNLLDMKASYKEIHGKTETSRTVSLSTLSSDFVYLPAETCIKEFYLTATYLDNENKEQTTKSVKVDLPILHQPKRLSASIQANGNAFLRWEIDNANWQEISGSDTWEVQRNVTGDPTNGQWMSLGQVSYSEKDEVFSYEDPTLLSSYQGADVYYRVRRIITAVWDWNMRSGYAMIKIPATMALPTISEATVSRSGNWNENSHEVSLNFFVGARGAYDKDGRIILRNAADWEAFATRVNNGETRLNAVMAADINLGASQTKVGTFQNPYSGTFDGNGHTLTVDYNKTNSTPSAATHTAPFPYIADATIKNLHVAGSMRSPGKFIAGIASWISGDATISNCHSSVTIQSDVSGDGTHAGLVGVIDHGKSLTLTDCLFDGSIFGVLTHSNGGLVGYAYDDGKLTMNRCLFAPQEVNTNTYECATLCRNKDKETAQNYYTQSYGSVQGVSAVGMSAAELAEALGSQWQVVGNKVIPISTTSLVQSGHTELEYVDANHIVLRTSKDWDLFVDLVNETKGERPVNVILAADITVDKPVGLSEDVWYRGDFDGNGHTLTVALDSVGVEYAAPFCKVKSSSFRNLRVCGKVGGGIHTAGLVGKVDDGATLIIENCHISTNVTGTGRGNISAHLGGFVGHGEKSEITMRNCLFDGTISAEEYVAGSYAGAFIGWTESSSNTVSNCLEQGCYYNVENAGANYLWPDAQQAWSGSNNYSTNNWSECKDAIGIEPSDLAVALGAQWEVVGANVRPVMAVSDKDALQNLIWDNKARAVLYIEKNVGEEVRYTERRELTDDERNSGKLIVDLKTSCVDHRFKMFIERGESTLPLSYGDTLDVIKTDPGDLAIYQFDSNVVLGAVKADTLQNGVSLSWEVERGQADYFRILRYDKLQPDSVVVLESEYTQFAYIDRKVRPQHNYVYTIEGVTLCEGENASSVSVEGCCVPTGMVRGYVRMTNGIGLPGYIVTAKPMGDIQGAEILTCVTDSTGYFEIGGLVYQKSGEYMLSVSDPTGEASFTSQSVSFDEDINLHTNVVFTQSNYYVFSGYVLYDGSSIPVSGVRFLRDGVEVVNSSGKPVTTNNQGAFEVSVPQGSHRIQVVKDGHVFKNDGFFITPDAKPDSTWHNWQKSVSEVYLWDETKVNLQGRVVGGNDQGLLPLGESLSTNNLGDDITIVFQLEGDNTSWIVRDQMNSAVTERHESYPHGKSDTTLVDSYRHRIVVHPDPATGEYMAPFYPVKFKVTEIYAKGYPTLFQTGMVSETVDLNDYADGDTAVYSRIYHSQPTLDTWQFNGTQDRYFGLKQYTALDNAGVRDTVILWNAGKYSMGYPVFMGGSSVPMLFSAREEYRYNNEQLGKLDIVQLNGGKVIIGNGLAGNDVTHEVELDSLGQGTYVFTPQNVTFTLNDDMALRTMNLTLLYEDSYYDIDPVRGYVMAALPLSQGRRVVAGQNTHLVDILRDPPGSNSSAYIAAGSKFSYSYTADLSAQMGVNISLGMGSGSNYFIGIWAGAGGGGTTGTVNSSDNHLSLSYDLATTYYNDWSYEYEFETKEKIATSGNELSVGANADVYIGVTDNVIVEDAIAVRVVPSKTLERLRPGIGGQTVVNGHTFDVKGTAKVLASGWDEVRKDSVYLIRDEVMQTYSTINSTFAHSQSHLLNELIPSLIRTRNDLLLDSTTTSTYAQALADKLQQPVYVSKVSTDNPRFSLYNQYTIYEPTGNSKQWTDSIQALNNQINTWTGFIAANEKEKLEANKLLKVYDFDGQSDVEYSETLTTTDGQHRYWKLPTTVNLSGDGIGASGEDGSYDKTNDGQDVAFMVAGVYLSISLKPLFGFDFNYQNGCSTSYSKEAGFNLSCSRNSNLSVAVYHTAEISSDSIKQLQKAGDMGIFYKNVESNLKDIYNGRKGSSNTTSYIESLSKVPRYRNFVYRTLGGATASPWEDERRTLFYNPGMILDQKTMEIDQLRIWAKESSVSNVPYGEPARFTIYMTNESEMPALVTKALKYYLEDTSNAKGAKVFIDGAPLTGAGIDLWLEPNTIIEKQVEIYAGAEYDYEDIAISLMNENDVNRIKTVTLSAHFVPSAGKINISKPGDKWVVNTESAYDEERQAYYLPVHIDGFDVNHRNFDHIEFQYKLSTQGDKDWVNLCSYYRNDEEGRALMELASGERKLIEHDGFIDVAFYGEKDPIEQYYDLRAVTCCRQGNGYLTNSSNILKGIKDTRRPQLFGTPQPVDGILGIGDDIKLRFSEPIAGNYLSAVNNFEVIGRTNSSNVSLSSALRFNGQSYARSFASRSLEGKSFTVDVMLSPDDNGKPMTVFSHGEGDRLLELGLTADRRLTAAVMQDSNHDISVVTATSPCLFDGLREVFYVFDCDLEESETTVSFYDGNKQVGTFTLPFIYEGHGNLNLGQQKGVLEESENFEGEMLEFRLWNRALVEAEMDSYRQKRLTGYELGLLDNYPLNEGDGPYSYNRTAGGSDLALYGTSWKMPTGIGMKLDGEKGFRLAPEKFNRFDHEDYTLMFWFRTTDYDGTLLANGRAEDEAGAKSHFRFYLQSGSLCLRLGGKQMRTETPASNGQWHHAALSVNRSRNVGCLYFDKKLFTTFTVDTIGGIRGNCLAAGATYLDALTIEDALTGHIDEIAMYDMALPENCISEFADITPTGREMGLAAYLSFSDVQRQMQNDLRAMPTGVSLRRYIDTTTGELTMRRDTIVAQEDVERLYDRTVYAPMHDNQPMENIKFSYVADGNDLFINLDVPDASIEKTNAYIVVKDVADLQGNLMASPAVMDLYIYRNPLRWNDKHLRLTSGYGKEFTFTATLRNLSGKSRRFTLQGLPIWMTASVTSSTVGALDEETITFTVSPYINIGNYEEVISLVGEDGMSEPLPISLKVRGEEPDWVVDDELLHTNISMSIIGQVWNNGEVAHDSDDKLAVFDEEHHLLGVAHPDATSSDGLIYLNVYNSSYSETVLSFEFYDASAGTIRQMMANGILRFKSDTIIGTTTQPVPFSANNGMVQAFILKKGWNWVSFNVNPLEAPVKQLFNNATKWQAGDAVELENADGTYSLLSYKSKINRADPAHPNYSWDCADSIITIESTKMYRVYSNSEKMGYLSGFFGIDPINVKKGWNRIGYISNLNLPIGTAMAEYAETGSVGDIIKSQSEFAMLTEDASGNRSWRGTLKYMRVGEGYMLKHNSEEEVSFFYPTYVGTSRYSGWSSGPNNAPLMHNTSGSSMTMVAAADGLEVLSGDRLIAYRGSVPCGIAEADEQGVFYLNVGDTDSGAAPLTFTVERDGEVLATAGSHIRYVADAALGTPDQPTSISFLPTDRMDAGGWYTISGLKLDKRPTQRGVYIHDKEKVVIK